MKVEEIEAALRRDLSPRRFTHTMGVVDAARRLAERYGASREQAELAALLHDCAKELPLAEMQALVEEAAILVDEEMASRPNLLHGLAGRVRAEYEFRVTDQVVLQAIERHTVGSVAMTTLDKIIFLADYIEDNRLFPGVEELRRLAFEDLDRAVLKGFDSTISFLLEQKQDIYVRTVIARNDMVHRLAGNGKVK